MTINQRLLFLLMIVVGSSMALGEETAAELPQPIEKCFQVHGRMFLANGTPSVRIWVIGTGRMLGVDQSYDAVLGEVPAVPPEVKRRLTDFQTELFGDFMVCPLTRQKPGEMQIVYVEAAKNLLSRQRH